MKPPLVTYDDALRERVTANLSGHTRRIHEADGRRRAAVAVLLVDSEVGEDRFDPAPWSQSDIDRLPGKTENLDGRMADVAGGPKPRVAHRFYHVPASNTAVGHMILENER